MKVQQIDHGLVLAANPPGFERGAGVHMSDIYNALYAELEPERYAKGGGPDAAKMELGMAFEEILEPAIARRLFSADRPGELRTTPTEGGILYSPDHFLFNGVFRLGEFKATWYTARVPITDHRFDKWFCQMKAYCYHVNTPHARLYVFFVNGDYKPPTPRLVAYDIEFTLKELNDNWQMLKRFAQKRGLWNA